MRGLANKIAFFVSFASYEINELVAKTAVEGDLLVIVWERVDVVESVVFSVHIRNL